MNCELSSLHLHIWIHLFLRIRFPPFPSRLHSINLWQPPSKPGSRRINFCSPPALAPPHIPRRSKWLWCPRRTPRGVVSCGVFFSSWNFSDEVGDITNSRKFSLFQGFFLLGEIYDVHWRAIVKSKGIFCGKDVPQHHSKPNESNDFWYLENIPTESKKMPSAHLHPWNWINSTLIDLVNLIDLINWNHRKIPQLAATSSAIVPRRVWEEDHISKA